MAKLGSGGTTGGGGLYGDGNLVALQEQFNAAAQSCAVCRLLRRLTNAGEAPTLPIPSLKLMSMLGERHVACEFL